jgi:6-phosphofructokinase 1
MMRAYVRAGPREFLFHDPAKVVAGIVTCGGLCPGLNNVIREVYHSLRDLYGVDSVYGFRGGFGGIYTLDPIELTGELLHNAHNMGGTILSSSRGGFDAERILDKLDELGVTQLYCIGGDGTMRGAFKLHQLALQRALLHQEGHDRVVAVAGIPKTIDNDLIEIDRSFGFTTAVEEVRELSYILYRSRS